MRITPHRTQTPLALAILQLLHERDLHPYEMQQLIRERSNALTDQCVLLSRQPTVRNGIGKSDKGVSNASVNPARSTATAIFGGSVALSSLWLFWVAPIVGGVIGGSIARWLQDE